MIVKNDVIFAKPYPMTHKTVIIHVVFFK